MLGHTFVINDEEVLSDIKFFNESYVEIHFKSSNKSMSVWLKPYQTDDKNNSNCLYTGRTAFGSIKGTAILSVCRQPIVSKPFPQIHEII